MTFCNVLGPPVEHASATSLFFPDLTPRNFPDSTLTAGSSIFCDLILKSRDTLLTDASPDIADGLDDTDVPGDTDEDVLLKVLSDVRNEPEPNDAAIGSFADVATSSISRILFLNTSPLVSR